MGVNRFGKRVSVVLVCMVMLMWLFLKLMGSRNKRFEVTWRNRVSRGRLGTL